MAGKRKGVVPCLAVEVSGAYGCKALALCPLLARCR